jgi:hypothetical protein
LQRSLPGKSAPYLPGPVYLSSSLSRWCTVASAIRLPDALRSLRTVTRSKSAVRGLVHENSSSVYCLGAVLLQSEETPLYYLIHLAAYSRSCSPSTTRTGTGKASQIRVFAACVNRCRTSASAGRRESRDSPHRQASGWSWCWPRCATGRQW